MSSIKKKSLRWYFFRAPVYLYRWGLGGLLGRRVLLLKHTGRRSGRQRKTVLEVVQYRKEIPEVFVVSGFGSPGGDPGLRATKPAHRPDYPLRLQPAAGLAIPQY
jgi:hypothetical protein